LHTLGQKRVSSNPQGAARIRLISYGSSLKAATENEYRVPLKQKLRVSRNRVLSVNTRFDTRFGLRYQATFCDGLKLFTYCFTAVLLY